MHIIIHLQIFFQLFCFFDCLSFNQLIINTILFFIIKRVYSSCSSIFTKVIECKDFLIIFCDVLFRFFFFTEIALKLEYKIYVHKTKTSFPLNMSYVTLYTQAIEIKHTKCQLRSRIIFSHFNSTIRFNSVYFIDSYFLLNHYCIIFSLKSAVKLY